VEFKLACRVRQALCGQMPIYLADDIHLDDPFGLPLITCVRYHVRTTALETELWRCRPTNLEQSAALPTDTGHQLQTF